VNLRIKMVMIRQRLVKATPIIIRTKKPTSPTFLKMATLRIQKRKGDKAATCIKFSQMHLDSLSLNDPLSTEPHCAFLGRIIPVENSFML
jgi:hypothetical protein